MNPTIEGWSGVAREMMKNQSDKGDVVPREHVPNLPILGRITFHFNVPNKVKERYETWGSDKRGRFTRLYGPVGEFIGKTVDLPLLSALPRFWDPIFHCFSFGNLDLCPLLEELAAVLGVDETGKCYSYKKGGHKAFEILTSQPVSEMTTKGVLVGGLTQVGYLVKLVDKRFLDEDFEFGIVALIIYGQLIFPKKDGFVDEETAKFVLALKEGERPNIPVAILTELIRALDKVCKSGGGDFEGSAHILQLWFGGHFMRLGAGMRTYGGDWINSFFRQHKKMFQNARGWIDFLMSEDGHKEIVWAAPWISYPSRFLFGCKDLLWVPLIGVRGCSCYTPWAFRRQVREHHQFVPATAGMTETCYQFDYSHEKSPVWTTSLKDKWARCRFVGRGFDGELVDQWSKHYKVWRARRGRGVILPRNAKDETEADGIILPQIPTEEELLREHKAKIEKEKEELYEKMSSLEEKNGILQYLLEAETENGKRLREEYYAKSPQSHYHAKYMTLKKKRVEDFNIIEKLRRKVDKAEREKEKADMRAKQAEEENEALKIKLHFFGQE